MTDTEPDSQPSAEGAAEPISNPARTDMTIVEVRQWLRNWVSNATGQSPDAVDEATPMVELGLSSRDAVAMAADIEDRTGVTVSIAAAFEHPTIESLASWIVEGDPGTTPVSTTPTGRAAGRWNESTSPWSAWPPGSPVT